MFSAQSLLVGNGSSVTYLRKIPWANQSIECRDVCNAAHGSEFLAIMTSLLQRVRDQRVRPFRTSAPTSDSTSWMTDAKRFLLEKLIIDNSSSACGKMLSCIEERVFKSTLKPIFAKKHHEAFLEFGLGIVSFFNKEQNQINSVLRRHCRKKLEEKPNLHPIPPR